MYVKTINGELGEYPYSLSVLKQQHPETSFPKVMPDALLAEYGVCPVIRTERPEIDIKTQTAQPENTPTLINGAWTLGWVIHQKTEAELERDLADASWSARKTRDRLLSETDWMALSDNTMTPEWASYRQALRDITSQEGFPYSVIWPIKPE